MAQRARTTCRFAPLLLLLAAPARAAAGEPAGPPVGGGSPLMTLVALLLVLACGVAGYLYVERLRHGCPRCKRRMERLDDETVEALLTRVERTEARLGSVRFALWSCAACNEETRERHVDLRSGYGCCPSCGAQALARRTWTVERATYARGGLERIDECCESCGYAASRTRSTPRLHRPAKTRSAAGAFSSSSSGFAGGRSSGDPATGGW